jgi:hypothetical protein
LLDILQRWYSITFAQIGPNGIVLRAYKDVEVANATTR